MGLFPPKRILVPLDLSALSAAAWEHAVLFARIFKSELEVVYVQEWARTEVDALPAPPISAETRRSLAKRVRGIVGAGPAVSIGAGDPVQGILRSARMTRADMILMGTHGRTGMKRAFWGSVAESVARRSPVPVLAVRGRPAAIGSVLAPVNFTDYSYHGFMHAAALAAGLGARLTALHVHGDPVWGGNPASKLSRLVESLPPEIRGICEPRVATEGSAVQGILDASGRHDLVVLVAHEKSGLTELVLGTTAERVLRGARSSVLVVPVPRGSPPLRTGLPGPCCAHA